MSSTAEKIRERNRRFLSIQPIKAERDWLKFPTAEVDEPALDVPTVLVRDIARSVSEVTGVSIVEIMSPRRAPHLCDARFIICLIARELTTRSLPEIGRVVGRDHSTVFHSIRRAEEEIARNPGFAAMVALSRKRALEIAGASA